MPGDQDKSSVTAQGESAPVKSQLDTFLAEIKQLASTGTGTRGRLIFALDATASREATWDTACKLQAEMFQAAATVGSLDLQLVFYRGLGECRASHWISDSAQLAKIMSQIMCRAGETQIEKVLSHASKETKLLKVSALVLVGDALEESPDIVLSAASALGRLGVPAFMFRTPDARRLLSLRSRRCPSIGRAPTRSRGLCYRRADSTCRPAQRQRGQALEPVEVRKRSLYRNPRAERGSFHDYGRNFRDRSAAGMVWPSILGKSPDAACWWPARIRGHHHLQRPDTGRPARAGVDLRTPAAPTPLVPLPGL
jgi:hypothetical protein